MIYLAEYSIGEPASFAATAGNNLNIIGGNHGTGKFSNMICHLII